jgi:zinc transport system permease protein
MIRALFEYQFLQNAVLGILFAGIACGIIGTVSMEKKLVMMSGGIAHTAFGGIGMGYFLNIEPIIGGLVFSVLAAFGIATIHRKTHTHSDILIGMFWSFGMALGILFIGFTPGYPPDMTSYLFGDILTISGTDLYLICILDIIIISIIFCFFNMFKSYMFDEEFTYVLGIRTTVVEYIVFLLIALTVVILIKVAGIILIIALLTIPPCIAKQFTYNLKTIMILSILFSIIFSFIGLWISYQFSLPSGATIIIVFICFYLITYVLHKICKKAS